MTDQAGEQEWLRRFQIEVKPWLRTAVVDLDAEAHRRGLFFTSVVDERSGPREIAFRVGPIEAQRGISLTYIGGGKVSVRTTQQSSGAQHDIDTLTRASVAEIAREWLITIGVL